MSPERMEHLMGLVGPLIQKKDTRFRKAIPATERLMLTLRFLASGDSQVSLSYLFRMGRKSVSRFVSETSEAIIQVLLQSFMSPPETEEQWRSISQEFNDLWQFPHVVGAIDGKHVVIESPAKSGTLYHNYKGTFSIVLLAICDARYNFTLVDVGQYGSNNDSGVLAQSKMNIAFEKNTLHLPECEVVPGTNLNVPYFLVGDEIFPLKPWLLRPYPGRDLELTDMIYNYRHSRARRVIENAFGILRARWRIFSHPIKASVQNTERYVMACLCLHNFLRQTENSLYTPQGFVDVESADGKLKEGEWRSQTAENGCFRPIKLPKGGRRKILANELRENLKHFVNSEIGSVPWQIEYVKSVGKKREEN